MDLLDLNSLKKQHLKYLFGLGAFFHQSSPETIAELSLDPKYRVFTSDYLKMVCLPGFVKDVEEKVNLLAESKLEKSAQSSPKHIDSASEKRFGDIESEEAQEARL